MARRMLAPINSIKHYINVENAEISTGGARTINVVTAVAQNAVAATTDVVEGSIVKAVFIEIWLKSKASAGSDTKFQLAVEKNPAGSAPVTFIEMNNLMAYENKRNIYFYSQGVMGDLTTQALPVIRQWFKIPRGKHVPALVKK